MKQFYNALSVQFILIIGTRPKVPFGDLPPSFISDTVYRWHNANACHLFYNNKIHFHVLKFKSDREYSWTHTGHAYEFIYLVILSCVEQCDSM